MGGGGGEGGGGRWVGGGGQSNDLAPTTARYPRNGMGTEWDVSGGNVRGGYWFPGAKTCSCAAHFAYRATVGSEMKCKMNERCSEKLEMHYRGRGAWGVWGGGGPCDENLSKSYYD